MIQTPLELPRNGRRKLRQHGENRAVFSVEVPKHPVDREITADNRRKPHGVARFSRSWKYRKNKEIRRRERDNCAYTHTLSQFIVYARGVAQLSFLRGFLLRDLLASLVRYTATRWPVLQPGTPVAPSLRPTLVTNTGQRGPNPGRGANFAWSGSASLAARHGSFPAPGVRDSRGNSRNE